MPKVNEEYFESKKNSILDTVEKICETKPLYKLTMKDIVNETGSSFGALYASFSDIDDVIAALINRLGENVDFEGDTKRILQTRNGLEEKLSALFRYFLEHARSTIASYGKFNYEMSVIITDERRRKKIEDKLLNKRAYVCGLDVAINLIEDNIASGYFKPVCSKESIYALIIAFFDGMLKDLTLLKCYGINALQGVTFEERDLADTLIIAVFALLKNKEKE